MALKSYMKHILHCSTLLSIISVSFYLSIGYDSKSDNVQPDLLTGILLIIQNLSFLIPIPVAILMFLGLFCFNAFADEVKVNNVKKRVPFLCIRTVTRGIYPELVLENVSRNMKTCFESGLEDFVMEVITDQKVGLPSYPRVREVVVPSDYKTKNGTLYKARALQYCLEENVNHLTDEDWIVHLDEETVMTPDSVRGIINFVQHGQHQLGQGMITYANERVVNWLTTLFDATRVTDDQGILKFQLRALHRLLLSWKGSFLVISAGVERKITFDHGPKGSVTEDINFGMMAVAHGYSFDFIEGEMWEKSPFTLSDFIKQRCRWSQGSLLITTNEHVPLKAKLLLCYATWSAFALPLVIPSALITMFYPIPCGIGLKFLRAFVYGVFSYSFIFGILRSFSLARLGHVKYLFCILLSVSILPPFKLVLDCIAILFAIFDKKLQFQIVDKILPAKARDAFTIV